MRLGHAVETCNKLWLTKVTVHENYKILNTTLCQKALCFRTSTKIFDLPCFVEKILKLLRFFQNPCTSLAFPKTLRFVTNLCSFSKTPVPSALFPRTSCFLKKLWFYIYNRPWWQYMEYQACISWPRLLKFSYAALFSFCILFAQQTSQLFPPENFFL